MINNILEESELIEKLKKAAEEKPLIARMIKDCKLDYSKKTIDGWFIATRKQLLSIMKIKEIMPFVYQSIDC